MKTSRSFKTTAFTYEATQCYKHKYHNLSQISYILDKYTVCDCHRWTAQHLEETTTVVFSFLITKKSASRLIPRCIGSSYQRRHVGSTAALYLRGPGSNIRPKTAPILFVYFLIPSRQQLEQYIKSGQKVKRAGPRKRWHLPTKQYGFKSPKTVILTLTATRISKSPHNLCLSQHIDITRDAYCIGCFENHNGNTFGTLRGSEEDNPTKVHCK